MCTGLEDELGIIYGVHCTCMPISLRCYGYVIHTVARGGGGGDTSGFTQRGLPLTGDVTPQWVGPHRIKCRPDPRP